MIMEWWKELKVEGWTGYRLATKLKMLKVKLKAWAKMSFADMKMQKAQLLEDIQNLDKKEEMGRLTDEEAGRRLSLKEEFQRTLREEEIMWRQRLRCKWLKEGDKNTKFFHGMASQRKIINRISSLLDEDRRLERNEEIIEHIKQYFIKLYSKERSKRPSLDNMQFVKLHEERMQWLERKFEEKEVRTTIFVMKGDKALGPDGYPMAL